MKDEKWVEVEFKPNSRNRFTPRPVSYKIPQSLKNLLGKNKPKWHHDPFGKASTYGGVGTLEQETTMVPVSVMSAKISAVMYSPFSSCGVRTMSSFPSPYIGRTELDSKILDWAIRFMVLRNLDRYRSEYPKEPIPASKQFVSIQIQLNSKQKDAMEETFLDLGFEPFGEPFINYNSGHKLYFYQLLWNPRLHDEKFANYRLPGSD